MKYQKSNTKNQNYILKFKIFTFYIVVLIFTFYILMLPTSSSAQTASSTPSAEIKTKLEEFKKEIASKAAKLKLEVNRKLQNKVYVGHLKTKTDSSLTLATDLGPKIVTINQDTLFETKVKSKQKFSLKNLADENYVAGLGDIDETNVLTAKKIILLPQPDDIDKIYLWGQVISISDRLITIKNNQSKNFAVSLPSQVVIKKGEEEVALNTLRTNDFVIVSGKMGKNEIVVARFIYLYPLGAILKPKSKLATPQASSSGKKK